MKKLYKGLVVASVTLLAASSAYADTASDTVDATAGIQPALELSCTDVSFGVWRIPVRTGAVTTITLNAAANTVAASGNTARVSQSTSDASWANDRGTCTLSGSLAADDVEATIAMSGQTDMAFTGQAEATTGYVGLNAPTADAGLEATLTAPETSAITNGATTFYIGGVLTIPGDIVADNYGGYKTTTAATVQVDDLQE